MYKLKGFNDSHLHLLGLGYNKTIVDLSTYKSIEDIVKINTNDDYIIGRGWNQTYLKENRMLTKDDLNKISTNKPVVFIRVCGHILVANDKAMELANIDETTSVAGGTIDHRTGILTEEAIKVIYKTFQSPTKEKIKEMFIKGNDILLANGITSAASDDFTTLSVDYELIIECLEELYKDDLMKVRLLQQVNLPSIELLKDYISKGYHKKKYKGFKLGPLKILADGSLGARTALLKEPYSDDATTSGVAAFNKAELFELIHTADKAGMDVTVHAIGDEMVERVIDAIDKSLLITKRTNHRHSIIHNQLANKAQIKKMKELNIGAIVQPIFLNSDLEIAEKRLGDRINETYLFKMMYESGIPFGISTDAPVEPVNPFKNIYTAMTRKSINSPMLKPLLNEELFTLDEAIESYTTNNYYFSYDENNRFDDFIVVDRNIYDLDTEQIIEVEVLETYIDGKLVYKKG